MAVKPGLSRANCRGEFLVRSKTNQCNSRTVTSSAQRALKVQAAGGCISSGQAILEKHGRQPRQSMTPKKSARFSRAFYFIEAGSFRRSDERRRRKFLKHGLKTTAKR